MGIKNVVNTDGFYLDREVSKEYYIRKEDDIILDESFEHVQENDDDYWECWETGEEFNNLEEVIESLRSYHNKIGNKLEDFGYYLNASDTVWEMTHDGGYGITIEKVKFNGVKNPSYTVSIFYGGELQKEAVLNTENEVEDFLIDIFEE